MLFAPRLKLFAASRSSNLGPRIFTVLSTQSRSCYRANIVITAHIDMELLALYQADWIATFKHSEYEASFSMLIPSPIKMDVSVVAAPQSNAVLFPSLADTYSASDVSLAVDRIDYLINSADLLSSHIEPHSFGLG